MRARSVGAKKEANRARSKHFPGYKDVASIIAQFTALALSL
jgi:hypothetical protein